MIDERWRADAAAWWASPRWRNYERDYGDAFGARTALLATATWSTRVLDLAPEPLALLRGMRKGRRAEIHAGERRWTVGDAFSDYALLHRIAHDWPRPLRTYGHQADWIASGHGLVRVVYDAQREPIAAVYVIRNGCWAYYASSAAYEPNATAVAIWRAMLALRGAGSGVRWFELGWQGEVGDEKGKNVEAYKRGFGGVDVPVRLP